MTTVYEFKDDSWWDDDQYMECYNCTSHEHGYGSAHNEEDCYIHALWDSCIIDEADNSVYDLSVDQLEKLCFQNDIGVVIYD